ncbi:MAG TPA: pseudouridine synthase [Usitatibacter sp.]|nr:pseudouridine synthase [Usitatibacter sp.]
MKRPTLKLPKKAAEPAAPSQARSTRAKWAQQQRGKKPAAATAIATPAPESSPPSPPKRRARPAAPAQKKREVRPHSSRPPPQKSAQPAPRPPRPVAENPDEPRLSKRLSELGLCSRREADEWIENGWVRVNGQVVSTLGARVTRDASIEVDAAAKKHQNEQVTILLNKPVGYVSGQPEDNHQPAMVLIKPENRWAEDPSRTKFLPGHLRGLAPAGRLDIDSTGLLVFTQDGRVAKRLIGQDSEVEKEYLVRVEGTLDEAGMKLLQHGLELDGVKLKPAKVSWANEDQLRFVLREGRKRQIRRMCEMVGLVVTALKRVRSGGVSLGPLPVGQWRYLGRNERF